MENCIFERKLTMDTKIKIFFKYRTYQEDLEKEVNDFLKTVDPITIAQSEGEQVLTITVLYKDKK